MRNSCSSFKTLFAEKLLKLPELKLLTEKLFIATPCPTLALVKNQPPYYLCGLAHEDKLKKNEMDAISLYQGIPE